MVTKSEFLEHRGDKMTIEFDAVRITVDDDGTMTFEILWSEPSFSIDVSELREIVNVVYDYIRYREAALNTPHSKNLGDPVIVDRGVLEHAVRYIEKVEKEFLGQDKESEMLVMDIEDSLGGTDGN